MAIQDLTVSNHETELSFEKCQPLNYAREQFIEWYAMEGQLVYSLDSHTVVKRSSLAKLARDLGVSRQTLYVWPTLIQNFVSRVSDAKEGLRQSNVGAAWNSILLQACDGNIKAAELFLSNFDPKFISPRYKANQVSQNRGFADLVNRARKKEVNKHSVQI